MSGPKHLVDVKCYELAEHFLDDWPEGGTKDQRDDLAWAIQCAAEDWLSATEMERCGHKAVP